jgi:hypothetical protein
MLDLNVLMIVLAAICMVALVGIVGVVVLLVAVEISDWRAERRERDRLGDRRR